MSNFTITIARGFGSGGRAIGSMLARRFGINYYDRDLIKLASEESGINIALFGKADEKVKSALFKHYNRSYGKQLISPGSVEFTSDDNLFNYQAKIIRDLSEKESCVIVGRCADFVLRNRRNVLRVFIYASRDFCIQRVAKQYSISEKEAEHQIDRVDRARGSYYRYYTGHQWDNARNYDLCLNSEELGYERCVDIISHFATLLYPDESKE